MGKDSLFVSLAEPTNKVVLDFGAKVSSHRRVSRNSVYGLGASSWRDVVLGLKKDSQTSFCYVVDVGEPPALDRDFVLAPWLTGLEGSSIVDDCCQLGLSILDEVLFPETFGSVLQGGSSFVVGGRDAFLFPKIDCPFGVVEDDEVYVASSMVEVIDESHFPFIAPSKAFSRLVVDPSQALSVFSPSINRLGIRGIVFNDSSVGVVLVNLLHSLVFREGKVVMTLSFDSQFPLSFLRSSPDVSLMDACLDRFLFDFLPLCSLLHLAEVVDVGSYKFDLVSPTVADDVRGFSPSRPVWQVLCEDGEVAQHQIFNVAVGLVAPSLDASTPDVHVASLPRRRGRPKKVKRSRKPRHVPSLTCVSSVAVDGGDPSSSAIMASVRPAPLDSGSSLGGRYWTRAKKAWMVGKLVGCTFDGGDEVTIHGLAQEMEESCPP